jgi:membrane protease YdiL (CAAX protease family)
VTTRRSRSRRLPLWVVLTQASVVTTLAVLPYALELQRQALEAATARRTAIGKRRGGRGQIATRAAVQAELMFGIAAWSGLKLGRGLGLGAPYLEDWLMGRPRRLHRRAAGAYVLSGLAAASVTSAVDAWLFRDVIEEFRRRGIHPPAAWRGILAATYAGVAEEVLVRLGVQTALAAATRQLTGDSRTPPGARTMLPAIAGSSIAFGLGHLPTTHSLGLRGRAVVARTLTLNAIPGVVFGTLYWRRGLEASMIAHFATALTLTVGVPPIERMVAATHRATS